MNATTINEFFDWITKNIDKNTDLYKYSVEYIKSQQEEFAKSKDEDRPFLSVITRTQGKRPEMLTETLLGLTGQSNTNFELLVIGHNLNDSQFEIVNGIIGDMPEWMRTQTRFIPVNGGTRTTPLNVGFESARGKYIAILDDDDIVFDNWVEEFYKMSQEKPGQVLHTYAIYQDWATVSGTTIPRAVGAPTTPFCKDFKLVDEIAINVCPPVCLAFPAFVFNELGIHFDESLTTTEDWDYLMRVAFITGVYNNSTTTCVYRNWVNAENSQTVHSKKEWDDNYDRIVKRFLDTPIIMPIGSLKRCVSVLTKGAKNVANSPNTGSAELFYNLGDGFYSDKTIPLNESSCTNQWTHEATDLSTLGNIKSLRFDPCDEGNVLLKNISIKIIDSNDKIYEYNIKTVKTNGFVVDDGSIAFLKSDPQVIINFSTPVRIKEFYVNVDLEKGLSNEVIDYVINKKRTIIYKVVRKICGCLKRIIKRG